MKYSGIFIIAALLSEFLGMIAEGTDVVVFVGLGMVYFGIAVILGRIDDIEKRIRQ